MKWSSTVGCALLGALVLSSLAAAQRPVRRAPVATPDDDKVGVAIAIQAGGDSYRFTGRATCKHERRGSIYMVPASLWSVDHSEGTHGVHLTFWRPASGSGDMFTLSVRGGGKTYAASTVKTPHGGSPEGSGQVRFAPEGAGGTFTVEATTASGTRISGTLKCDAFGAVYAEGGN